MEVYVLSLMPGECLLTATVYKHQSYPYWIKGKVCLLGDAGTFFLSFPDQPTTY